MPKLNLNKREVMQKILDDSQLEELLAIIATLDEQTKAEVLKALSTRLNINGKGAALSRVRTVIQGHDDAIKDWVLTGIANSYSAGANMAFADIKKSGISIDAPDNVYTEAFTAEKIATLSVLTIHKDAVNALAADAYLDFANGMNGLVKGAEHQLNDALKRQTRATLIAGEIKGDDVFKIAREVRELIGNQGFSVLTDRGGGTWTLKRYSEMLVRTHMIKAANEGALNRIIEFGIDTIQISQHDTDPSDVVCSSEQGKIYSISGDSEKYPKLELTPPYHPNCRHTVLPRPFLSDPT